MDLFGFPEFPVSGSGSCVVSGFAASFFSNAEPNCDVLRLEMENVRLMWLQLLLAERNAHISNRRGAARSWRLVVVFFCMGEKCRTQDQHTSFVRAYFVKTSSPISREIPLLPGWRFREEAACRPQMNYKLRRTRSSDVSYFVVHSHFNAACDAVGSWVSDICGYVFSLTMCRLAKLSGKSSG